MDTHRLVRIELDGLVYFADIGNGWPAVIPFPAHESIQYTAFGMSFRSKLSNEIVSVFHKIGNEEKLMVEIPINLSLRKRYCMTSLIDSQREQNIHSQGKSDSQPYLAMSFFS